MYEQYLYLIQQELSGIADISLKRLSAMSKIDLWVSFYTKKKSFNFLKEEEEKGKKKIGSLCKRNQGGYYHIGFH